ncbi:MAG TPA: hypothetical protein VKF36_05920 [Syntrophorhabdales bacterium]|nr:hypothetical protein [Syntrophorhabdales bacterium]
MEEALWRAFLFLKLLVNTINGNKEEAGGLWGEYGTYIIICIAVLVILIIVDQVNLHSVKRKTRRIEKDDN